MIYNSLLGPYGSGRTLWCYLFHKTALRVEIIDGRERDVVGCRRCDQWDVPRWGSRTAPR